MERLSNHAAKTLQGLIRDGTFPAGAPLPGQRQLALDLGIGRGALREAVSTLEALGLVRTQPGKGVFVTAGVPRTLADLPQAPLAGDARDIFEFRAVVEPGAASLAALDADRADLARLAAIQRDMEAALRDDDLVGASEADLAFHLAVAHASGNATLDAVIRSLEPSIAYSLRLPFADVDGAWTPAHEHRAVLHAIAARDGDAAHAGMRDHIASAARRVGLSLDPPNAVRDPHLIAGVPA